MMHAGKDQATILVMQLGPVPADPTPAPVTPTKPDLPPIPQLPFSPMDVKMFVDGML